MINPAIVKISAMPAELSSLAQQFDQYFATTSSATTPGTLSEAQISELNSNSQGLQSSSSSSMAMAGGGGSTIPSISNIVSIHDGISGKGKGRSDPTLGVSVASMPMQMFRSLNGGGGQAGGTGHTHHQRQQQQQIPNHHHVQSQQASEDEFVSNLRSASENPMYGSFSDFLNGQLETNATGGSGGGGEGGSATKRSRESNNGFPSFEEIVDMTKRFKSTN